MRQRRWRSGLMVAGLAAVVAATGHPVAGAAPPAPAPTRPAVSVAADETALVRLRLPDVAFLDRLVAEGADLAGRPRTEGSAVLADIVVTGRELAGLTARGAVPLQVVQRAADGPARHRASVAAAQQRTRAGLATKATTAAVTDTLQSSCRPTSGPAAGRPSCRPRSPRPRSPTRTWRSPSPGGPRTGPPAPSRCSGSRTRGSTSTTSPCRSRCRRRRCTLTATSSLGGTRSRTTQLWPNATPAAAPSGYQTRLHRRVHDADGHQGPDRAGWPGSTATWSTSSTCRTAPRATGAPPSAYVGDPATAAIVVESVKFGDQGVNGYQVRTVDPAPRPAAGALPRPGAHRVAGDRRAGKTISTTDQVAALITRPLPDPVPRVRRGRLGRAADAGGRPGHAWTTGCRPPARCRARPWTVQALRIG